MIDAFREIFSTIRKNKMRTFLTGFSVAWGIFMLIILLASGNGLKNGVMENFAGRAQNAMSVRGGRTSMPYNGMSTGRRIKFEKKDMEMFRKTNPEIEYLSATIYRDVTLTRGDKDIAVSLEGSTPDGQYIDNLSVPSGQGRYINDIDERDRRKVILLHDEHVKVLFGKNEDPIGQYVTANNKIVYRVVGIYESTESHGDPSAFIPFMTADMLYKNLRWGYNNIQFTVKGIETIEANDQFVERMRERVGAFKKFDPKDRSALNIWNSAKQAVETNQMFNMITIFIIIVGIASLMAGIVGVGNIMLITVKERTREIGIRKAIGAKPMSVLWLIILEAVFITTCAGYVGIVLGVALSEYVNINMQSAQESGGNIMFSNPTVDLGIVIYATLFLIVCGVVAGAIPAYKATKVSPIEAMRAE